MISGDFFNKRCVLLLLALPVQAWAGDAVEQACGKSPGSAPSSGQPTQRQQQCQAARDAQDGANASSALSKVWGGVATVCGGVCASSLAGASPASGTCTAASLGGSGTEAAVTKNYTAALTPVGAQAQGMLGKAEEMPKEVDADGNPVKPKDGAKKKDRDLSACASAATAASTSYSNHSNMKNSEASAAQALEAAQAAQTAQGPEAAKDGVKPVGFDGAPEGGGVLQQAAAGDAGGAVTADSPKATCAAARESNSVSDTIRCAVASDPKLPSYVSTPQFARDFQKTSGMGLQDFFAKNDSPTRTIAQATSGSLNAVQTARLGAVLGAMERGETTPMSFTDSGSVYATSGSSPDAGGSEGDGMEGLGEALAGLMQQMLPKDPEAEKHVAGMKLVIFANGANQNRSPAGLSEEVATNKTLSIFDRVTYRYYFVARRVGGGA